MKTLSILELLKREYLNKEIDLYISKRKTWNNWELVTFHFDEPRHLDNYEQVVVTIDDIYYDENYDCDECLDYQVYKFRFDYQENTYHEDFLK